jgi:hypothetical protein
MKLAKSSSRNAVHGALALMLVIAQACGGKTRPTDSVKTGVVRQPDSVANLSGGAADTSDASAVRQAQTLYDYGKERPASQITDREFPGPVVDDSLVPRVWVATATLKTGTQMPANRILARIRSARAYPPMGLVAGYNYVWRSSWDSTAASSWQTKIISGDTAATAHVLTRDPRNREYTHGVNAREPRIVRIRVHSMALGVCLDDPVCGTGHCGYY